jgi:hypothetical protein
MPSIEAPGTYFHIRRLNPNRDLSAVADLVEDAFELKDDPEGRLDICARCALMPAGAQS